MCDTLFNVQMGHIYQIVTVLASCQPMQKHTLKLKRRTHSIKGASIWSVKCMEFRLYVMYICVSVDSFNAFWSFNSPLGSFFYALSLYANIPIVHIRFIYKSYKRYFLVQNEISWIFQPARPWRTKTKSKTSDIRISPSTSTRPSIRPIHLIEDNCLNHQNEISRLDIYTNKEY